jgi:hypothetical protein
MVKLRVIVKDQEAKLMKLLIEQNDRDLKLAQFHYDRSAAVAEIRAELGLPPPTTGRPCPAHDFENVDVDQLVGLAKDALVTQIKETRQALLPLGTQMLDELVDEEDRDTSTVGPFTHPNTECRETAMSPIVGLRYHLIGKDYDLCEAAFDALSDPAKLMYELIYRPGSTPIMVSEFMPTLIRNMLNVVDGIGPLEPPSDGLTATQKEEFATLIKGGMGKDTVALKMMMTFSPGSVEQTEPGKYTIILNRLNEITQLRINAYDRLRKTINEAVTFKQSMLDVPNGTVLSIVGSPNALGSNIHSSEPAAMASEVLDHVARYELPEGKSDTSLATLHQVDRGTPPPRMIALDDPQSAIIRTILRGR